MRRFLVVLTAVAMTAGAGRYGIGADVKKSVLRAKGVAVRENAVRPAVSPRSTSTPALAKPRNTPRQAAVRAAPAVTKPIATKPIAAKPASSVSRPKVETKLAVRSAPARVERAKTVAKPAAVAVSRPKTAEKAVAASGGGQPRALSPAASAFLRQKAEADRRQQGAAARQAATPRSTPQPIERPRQYTMPQPERRWNQQPNYQPYYVWPNRRYWNPYRDGRYHDDDYYYGYSPYGYRSSPYGYGYPYGSGYAPYYTPYVPYSYAPWLTWPPPVFMPADQLFGPGPILRMMGVDQWFNPPVANVPPQGAIVPRGNGIGDGGIAGEPRVARRDADDAPADDRPERGTNQKATALAWRFITFGDSHFANQKYSEAYDRYKKAAQSGQVADAWFRQGFALAALGRYEQGVKAIKRGMELRPGWAESDFQLDELFGKDEVAKKARLDAMLQAAEEDPNNGDLMYLLGVHLHFDGKADQAAAFFKRAADIGGNDLALTGFVRKG